MSVNSLGVRSAIFDDIKKNVAFFGGEGKIVYINDQSDHTIAEKHGVEHWVVRRIRSVEFGILARHAKVRVAKAPLAKKVVEPVADASPIPDQAQAVINNTILSMLKMRNDLDAMAVEVARVGMIAQRLCDELDIKFTDMFKG